MMKDVRRMREFFIGQTMLRKEEEHS